MTESPRSWRRKAARPLIVVGVGAAVWTLVPEIPKENVVRLRLDPTVAPASQVDLTWTESGSTLPSAGVSLRFPEKAPKLVEHSVSLRDGEYQLDVVIHGAHRGPTGNSETSYRRRLHLRGGEVTVFLAERHVVQPPHSSERGSGPQRL